jgi:hypothetical protein
VAAEYGVGQIEKEGGIFRENFGDEIEKAVGDLQKALQEGINSDNEPEEEEDIN